MVLSKNIKQLLSIYNITISDLSRLTKTPRSTINRLINDEATDPRISTLKSIASYFNISVEDLLSEDYIKETIYNNNSHTLLDITNLLNSNSESNSISENILKLTSDQKTLYLTLDNDSMSPMFEPNNVLVFDCKGELSNRDFTLAYINKYKNVVFRQLLVEGQNKLLKSINHDFPIIHLHSDDILLAKLVKSIKHFVK
jgi:transcriptional regulator with XRE-family HTH domain